MNLENSNEQDNRVEKFKDLMGRMLDKTIEATKTVATKANETYHDPEVRQSVKSAGHSLCSATKEAGSKIVTGAKDAAVQVRDDVREKGVVKFSIDLGAKVLDSTLDVGYVIYKNSMSTALEIKQNSTEKGIFGCAKELTGEGLNKIKQAYFDVAGLFKGGKNQQKALLLENETQETDTARYLSQDSPLDITKPSQGQPLREKSYYQPI